MSGSEPHPTTTAQSYCPTCKAVFRGGFQRCPNDGARLDPGASDPLVGTVLAERYHIEAVIGDGGIGRVYRARHVRMSRKFAIKVPFGELGYDRKARARFANEAEAASRLSHPNVIGIVDVGETAEGLFYMAMDLADGPNLADAIGDGPLALARVLPILIQLADGLAHAHDRGLVHRDLKPENVIITTSPDGSSQVRIVDFGLAIVDAVGTERDRLTTEGVVLGTPHYMAPEQATDEHLDFRVDLFALGIILFEMLAGVHPFDGAPIDVARQNLSRDLPSIRARSGIQVDALVEALVWWLTRKSPSERPAHAGLVAQYARHLVAGQRGAAHAMLPEQVPQGDLGAMVEVSDGDEPAAPPAVPPPLAVAPPLPSDPNLHVPILPRVAERPVTTARVEPGPSPARRWRVVALILAALAGAVVVVALVAGGDGDRDRAASPVDAAIAVAELAVADAAVAAEPTAPVDAMAAIEVPHDAAEMIVRPTDARTAVRRVDAAAVSPPVDAAVARPPPIDAAPRPPRVDAALPDAPAPTLKGLYEQVGKALDTAMTRHGRDATQRLRDRYAAIPPYLEAVRKPDLRAQAERQLKALLRDLAALE